MGPGLRSARPPLPAPVRSVDGSGAHTSGCCLLLRAARGSSSSQQGAQGTRLSVCPARPGLTPGWEAGGVGPCLCSPHVSTAPAPLAGQVFWESSRPKAHPCAKHELWLHPGKFSSFWRETSHSVCKGRAQTHLHIIISMWRQRCTRWAFPPALGVSTFGINSLCVCCKAHK